MKLQSTCTDFFAELHKRLFNSALSEKSKPDRVAVLVAGAFLGWLKLHSKVLNLLKQCKDIECTCLLYLFEEVLPLIFFHYAVIYLEALNLETTCP